MSYRLLSLCLATVVQFFLPGSQALTASAYGDGSSNRNSFNRYPRAPSGLKAAPGKYVEKMDPFVVLKDGKWEKNYLQALFTQGRDFEEKQWKLNDEQWSKMKTSIRVKFRDEDRTVHSYQTMGVDGKPIGWVFVFTIETPEGRAPAGAAIDNDGLIRSVGILTKFSKLAISKPIFLNQFNGKGLTSDWSFGPGVELVKGSEKEGRELAESLQKALFCAKVLSSEKSEAGENPVSSIPSNVRNWKNV